jgi:hypothetical protein
MLLPLIVKLSFGDCIIPFKDTMQFVAIGVTEVPEFFVRA